MSGDAEARPVWHAQLRSIGQGVAEGRLEGHPSGLMVRTYRMDHELAVALWDGPHRVGVGSLFLSEADGTWEGECLEGPVRWSVRGTVGSGQLEFS